MPRPPFNDEEEDEPTFFQAYKTWILLGGLLVLGGGVYLGFFRHSAPSAPPKPERITMVQLPPPPPPKPKPVPTPPPVEKPPEQKPLETKDRMDDAPKPDAPKPEPVKAPDEPPPSMGSNIKGDGADSFGLSGSGNGGFVGLGGKGTGGGGGSAYNRYASQVKSRLVETLRQDKRTRAAAYELRVKLWIDEAGRVTRAEPVGTGSGPAATINLVGLQLAERPPAGMPMPLTAQIAGRRP